MERLGRYRLGERLGVGGMAEVFMAYRRGERGLEPVVIKRMLPHMAEDAHFVAMFRDEARLGARISHRGVCKVHELVEAAERPYIVMEYLRGVSLLQLVRRHVELERQLDLRLAIDILARAAEGLHAVHQAADEDGIKGGVVHRDVSLGNVLVTVNGAVKILDFGVAKSAWSSTATQTGIVKGKYAFMSPEQLRGDALDCRSDVFSLGTVSFVLTTLRHPFKRLQDYETIKAVVEYPVRDPVRYQPDMPRAVADVICKALSKSRDERYSSAREFRDALIAASRELGEPLRRREIGAEIRTLFADELRESRRRLTVPRRPRQVNAPVAPMLQPAPEPADDELETVVWSHAARPYAPRFAAGSGTVDAVAGPGAAADRAEAGEGEQPHAPRAMIGRALVLCAILAAILSSLTLLASDVGAT